MKHFDYSFRFLITILFFYANMYCAAAQGLVAIPNPSNDYICGYFGLEDDKPLIFQNKIVIRLRKVSSSGLVIAFYDGTNYTVINNPDAGAGCQGYPIVFNNNLYIRYQTIMGQNHLAQLNGNSWSLINNFNNGQYKEGEAITFNDKLYFRYSTTDGIRLAQFDGTNITIVPALQNISLSFPKPTVYKNKLYFTDWPNQQVIQFDGTNTVVLNQYPGPQQVGVVESFVHFQDTLFIRGQSNMVKTDGTNCYLVDIRNSLPPSYWMYHFQKEPVTFNNKLLFNVKNATSSNWAQYQNGVVQLIPNPTTGFGVEHEFTGTVVFNNKLYFRYIDANNKLRLAQLDGNTISLINTSLGYVNGTVNGNNFPIVFNNALYFSHVGTSHLNFGKYDGQQITLVQNSQQLIVMPSSPIIFNGNLYVRVVNYLAKLEEDFVKNEDIQKDISIFPNPANDYLVVSHPNVQESNIKIINIAGQEMLFQKLQQEQNHINISALPIGIYLIQLTMDGKTMSRKFTKQ